jgi:hypothetical protein
MDTTEEISSTPVLAHARMVSRVIFPETSNLNTGICLQIVGSAVIISLEVVGGSN